MKRRWSWLLLVPLAGALAVSTSKPPSEADDLRSLVPELALAAHGKNEGCEAWLLAGKADADEIARRLDGALRGRPGWIMPHLAPGTTFAYGNHYSPMLVPRWTDRLPFRLPDHRPVVDVMVGRAMRGDRELPHGPDWTTVSIRAMAFRAAVSGEARDPLEQWAIQR